MIRIGTDCSGIEAPIEALKQLKIPFNHIFSSEIDKYCIQSIKANYNPKIIFGDKDGSYPEGDITKRNITDIPDIDIYVCGFPCQPFSIAGERRGFKDKRGNIFFSCLDVIKVKKPKIFILENVKGILWHDKKRTFKIILEELDRLSNFGIDYKIKWKVLNTKDFGIPQNRERLFIIGIKSSDAKSSDAKSSDASKDFEWPSPKRSCKKIESYIDKKDTKINIIPDRIIDSNYLQRLPLDSIFVDFGFYKYTTYPSSNNICPCICTKQKHWCVPLKRYVNSKEYLSLQGFSKSFKQVVSNTQMKKQIGNSMSVNVIKCLIIECLKLLKKN